MNVAFFTSFECCPTIGGTERTTALVADALRKYYGYNIFSIYGIAVDASIRRHAFAATFQYTGTTESKEKLITFIKENNISVIITQTSCSFAIVLADLIKSYDLDCIQIFALHYSPGLFEKYSYVFRTSVIEWKKNKNLKNLIKILLYPLHKLYIIADTKRQYRKVELKVNKIVLLSSRYIREWIAYAHGNNNQRKQISPIFTAIPNGLTFNAFATKEQIESKQKRLLIVARLDESHKRISIALSIWKSISYMLEFNDWELDIVGEGQDRAFYQSKVIKEKIPRVNFYGRQDPEPYYRRSSIFIMTSQDEGLPMTLLEASQFGVVPFAFETFSSIYDIIENEKNGYTFTPGDVESYLNKLCYIMCNDADRIRIAQNAVENAREYTLETIASKWHRLISELVNRCE